jgi:alkylation response protein AidB-like acyl-CoA dehydrogenase
MTLVTSVMVVGAALFLISLANEFNILLWIGFIFISFLLFAGSLRKEFITAGIFKTFKKVLPPMNQTEREALEAGDSWWEKYLFSGKPDWKHLLDTHLPDLSKDEKMFLNNQVETLCEMIDDYKVCNEDKNLPPVAWEYIKNEGFLGLIIPKEYGGLGFSAIAHSTIVMKIASKSITAGVTCMVPNSLGPAELLLHYGTQEQKDRYLPGLAKGTEIPCFALTAPVAGSDAGAIPDKGIVCKGQYKGEEVLGIRLTFNKRYITLAPVSTIFGLAFKLYDPANLLGEGKTDYGITLALIPSEHEGVDIGRRHNPMGIPFMNGPIRGTDVFIPLDMIIGGREYAGKGWRMLMDCLSIGRGISLPALGAASGAFTYRMTGAYSTVRQQFKTSIGKFEGVEDVMAEIAGMTYSLLACRRLTVGAVDKKVKPSVASAISKYHMTEMGRTCINHAMDVHGGKGIVLGPKNYLGNIYTSMPISITVEGANILTRNLIIFGQGAVRSHPYVYKEMEAARNEDDFEGLNQFDTLLMKHVGFAASNFVRTFALGLTGGRIAASPINSEVGEYFKKLTHMSSVLALTADIAMGVLGGELKRKERLSARLGDILSHLYMGSAVLKYYHDNEQQGLETPYVHWCMQRHLFEAQKAFQDFIDNFPSRFIAHTIRFIAFPWGYTYKKPSDKLGHELVKPMMTNNRLRDRLTGDIFVGQQGAAAIVEKAFQTYLDTKDIWSRLKASQKEGRIPTTQDDLTLADKALEVGMITKDEHDRLVESLERIREAIDVDDFAEI